MLKMVKIKKKIKIFLIFILKKTNHSKKRSILKSFVAMTSFWNGRLSNRKMRRIRLRLYALMQSSSSSNMK